MAFGFRKVLQPRLGKTKELLVGRLDQGLELEGKMKVTSGDVYLNTLFKGVIDSEGAIIVAERGAVEAEVRAKVVTISGKLTGTVHASERLEISAEGAVIGDIFTPVLVVEPGGSIDGQCHMPSEINKQTLDTFA